MNAITRPDPDWSKQGEFSVEDGLDYLCKYGEPILAKHDRGWVCSISVFVTGEGVDFKVSSGYENMAQKSRDAVNKCVRLLHEAIEKITKGTK